MSEARIESDGDDLFVVYNGKRIAKRGHPGTPQAWTWVSIEPGYRVWSKNNVATFAGVSLSLPPSLHQLIRDGLNEVGDRGAVAGLDEGLDWHAGH